MEQRSAAGSVPTQATEKAAIACYTKTGITSVSTLCKVMLNPGLEAYSWVILTEIQGIVS